jgi:aldose 1-epimerase
VTDAAPVARAHPSATKAPYGTMPNGMSVELFTVRVGQLEMRVITYGAAIVSLHAPDRRGQTGDIVLGLDSVEAYVEQSSYLGAIVGRYANRIARGRFTLDGIAYQLATNDGAEHLHGGVRGFDKVVWTGTPFASATDAGVSLSYSSPDGEEGYPGRLDVTVTYTLTNRNELSVAYQAVTDKPTIVNLSQHSYFNLTGSAGTDVLGHLITIHADQFTPVDSSRIPTGEIASVTGTPFDFRSPAALGARIDDNDAQLKYGNGYDHNYVLRHSGGDALVHAAHVLEPTSGRTLDVHTTEPGLQLYSGNWLDGTMLGALGRRHTRRTGFCLETQHFPDSPNHPDFPSVVLRPNVQFRSRTLLAFGTEG